MSGNSSLNAAARDKNDEFYTRLSDIEKEMRHYRKHFKGKTIFCNCDDPFESNFFKYFVLNFNRLGLKKLIATCYATSPIAYGQLSLFDVLGGDEANKNKPYKAVVTQVYDTTGDGGIDMLDVAELFKMRKNELTELEGNGDFRSEECLELLKEADIVVTNPPFSLFREYMAVLVEYQKDFVIIGNQNALKYREIFPLLMNNRIWLGNNNPSPKLFYVPTLLEKRKNIKKDENGDLVASFGNICWYTNLDIKRRHEELIMIKKYRPEKYIKFENFNAIIVNKISDIPYDYEGVMGVPITFMNKYNPDQFEILGRTGDIDYAMNKCNFFTPPSSKEQEKFKKQNKTWRVQNGFYVKEDGIAHTVYDRLFIKNLNPESRKEG